MCVCAAWQRLAHVACRFALCAPGTAGCCLLPTALLRAKRVVWSFGRARAAVYGIVSCGGVMDIAVGAGGGIIGVDGGRRGRTVVVVVRVID